MAINSIKPKVTIKRADSWKKTIRCEEDDGTLIDCSGWKIVFILCDKGSYTIPKIKKTFDGSSTGITALELTPTELDLTAKDYEFQVTVFDNNGDKFSSKTGDWEIIETLDADKEVS